ncbi:DNA-binding pseudobarrel domain superfamily [Forsythia ovata]|uniref:DNA-binding pseudobarrel domain superfamily n=1 Tax=Forsythia ovata TaxID=205694 RepID=A0ABD1W593_9LAMI
MKLQSSRSDFRIGENCSEGNRRGVGLLENGMREDMPLPSNRIIKQYIIRNRIPMDNGIVCRLAGGWAGFYSANNIGSKDTCVFELMNGDAPAYKLAIGGRGQTLL